MGVRLAIAGATGAVGAEILRLIQKYNLPCEEIRVLASSRSVGVTIPFPPLGELTVEELREDSFSGINLALFSAGGDRALTFAPHAVRAGALVVDNSSAFRMDPDVPLVVPEVNPEAARKHKGIIANPNCSTIQLVVALAPLEREAGISRVSVATYQAVSGTGAQALLEYDTQIQAVGRGETPEWQVYPAQIVGNVIPQVDVFLEDGYTKEEMKLVHETRKILGRPDMRISATCVRVPVRRAHSEAVQIETKRELTPERARELLAASPGVKVIDNKAPGGYPMPLDVVEELHTYVGRIRKDCSLDSGLSFWVVADQLLKGAAWNAIQIAALEFPEWREALEREGVWWVRG